MRFSVQPDVNLSTGTVSYSLPLEITASRELTPALVLTYQAQSSNGLFGRSFDISIAKIQRSTRRGVPSYDDAQDIFLFASHGELVKSAAAPNTVVDDQNISWEVTYYFPLVKEQAHSIEYWCQKEAPQNNYWLVRDPNGINHIFGKDKTTKITDPEQPTHTFTWLLQESYDAKGNKILYVYDQAAEEATAYLRSIHYGKYYPDKKNLTQEEYAYEIRFDYGEYCLDDILQKGLIAPATATAYQPRPDPLLSYRAGFAIKTQRLCRNIFLLHRFTHLFNREAFLVKAWAFHYINDLHCTLSLLDSVQCTGYRKRESTHIDEKVSNESAVWYLSKAFPAVRFTYTPFTLNPTFDATKVLQFAGNLQVNSNSASYRFVDLYHEGLPGILYSTATATLYWRNQGKAKFADAEVLGQFPMERNLSSYRHHLMDIPGTDQLAFVVSDLNYGGFYESFAEGSWKDFQPFENYPTEFTHPAAQFIDINGTGNADVVLLDKDNPLYYPALGKKGYGVGQSLSLPTDFPLSDLNDADELVTFTNLFGDGLAHRVRVTRDAIEYWPNLGRGKFGAKHTLTQIPKFNDELDASRLFFINVKGMGGTDLVYVSSDYFEVYLNQNAARFASEPLRIQLPDQYKYTHLDRIHFTDLLGKGLASLIFSKTDVQSRYYYYEFAPEQLPFLLQKIDNQCGATAEIIYASSTAAYLEDRLEDRQQRKAAVQRCPAPSLVAEKITIRETNKLAMVERFKFHDGHYDTFEREFAGFGFVEQWDAETLPDNVEAKEENWDTPPTYTKRWYANRFMFKDRGLQRLTHVYSPEFFAEDKQAAVLSDSVFEAKLDNALSADEQSTLLSQLRLASGNSILRTEAYGLDKTAAQGVPYLATETNFYLHCLQAPTLIQRGVFEVRLREQISYHYERNTNDPQISHQFNLAWDDYANLLKSVTVHYRRRKASVASSEPTTSRKLYESLSQEVYPEQQNCKLIALDRTLQNRLAAPDQPCQFIGTPIEVRQLEIIKPPQPAIGSYYAWEELSKIFPATNDSRADVHLLNWMRYYYWNSIDASIRLPLLHHTENLVESADFFNVLYDKSFKSFPPFASAQSLEEQIKTRTGYLLEGNNWWQPSKVVSYHAADHFYLPKSITSMQTDPADPLWNETDFQWDVYALTIQQVSQSLYDDDATKRTTVAIVQAKHTIDYHVLAPHITVDANGTTSQVLYDPLGEVIAGSTYGKAISGVMGNRPLDEALREKLLQPKTLKEILQQQKQFLTQAGHVVFYNHEASPPWQATVATDQYQRVVPLLDQTVPQARHHIIVQYFDGLGHETQTKILAEPGNVFNVDEKQAKQEKWSDPRWRVSHYECYNNKGLVAKRYLPYYTAHADYEDQASIAAKITEPFCNKYDPLNRLVYTLTPQELFTKTVTHAWSAWHFDENDTLKESPYYKKLSADKQQLLQESLIIHDDTPHIQILDVQGRACQKIELERNDGKQHVPNALITRTVFDSLGQPLSHQDPRLSKPNVIYKYNKLGQVVRQDSVDSGFKLHLYNCYQKTICEWNSRNYVFSWDYDNWQREVSLRVVGGDPSMPVNYLHERTVYGDLIDNALEKNAHGVVIKRYDQSGCYSFDTYDMQGNCLEMSYELLKLDLAALLKQTTALPPVDWEKSQAPSKKFDTAARFNAFNQVVQYQNADGALLSETYDRLGQFAALQMKRPNEPWQAIIKQIAYSATGQRETISYGNEVTTRYTYEKTTLRLSELLTTGNKSGNVRTFQSLHYDYDGVGNIVGLDDQTYSELVSFLTPAADSKKLDPQAYRYDSLSRLQSATGKELSPTTPFSPSSTSFASVHNSTTNILLNLLPEKSKPIQAYQETYAYDAGNNLLESKHISLSNAPTTITTHEIAKDANCLAKTISEAETKTESTAQTTTFTYDPSGNLIQQIQAPPYMHVWDALNQLTYFKKGDDAVTSEEFYRYNSHHKRVAKITIKKTGTTVTEIREKYYIDHYEITRVSQLTSTGAVQTKSQTTALRLFDDEVCVATYTTKGQTSQLTYHLTNHLNSTVVELDKHAEFLTYEEYTPYGDTAFAIGCNEEALAAKTYRYSGKERDAESDYYYYGRRYYTASLGRWTSPDPAGLVDGLNVFAFVKGNPITFWDWSGLVAHSRARKKKPGPTKISYGSYADSKKNFEALGAAAVGDLLRMDLAQLKEHENFLTSALEKIKGMKESPSGHDGMVKKAVDYALADHRDGFNRTYREADQYQDEHLGTAMVYSYLKGTGAALSSGLRSIHHDMIVRLTYLAVKYASHFRLATEDTGYHLSSSEILQHPTRRGTGWYHPTRAPNHGTEDQLRAARAYERTDKSVIGHNKLISAADEASLYTLNAFSGPSTVSTVSAHVTFSRKKEQLRKRENIKLGLLSRSSFLSRFKFGIHYVRLYMKGSEEEAMNRSWPRDKTKRELSPPRMKQPFSKIIRALFSKR